METNVLDVITGQGHLEELSLVSNKTNPVSIQGKSRNGLDQGDEGNVSITSRLMVNETLIGARVNEGADCESPSMPGEMGLKLCRVTGWGGTRNTAQLESPGLQ